MTKLGEHPDTIPPCYNRPARADGMWLLVRWPIGGKPVYRYRGRWFMDRCSNHDRVGSDPTVAEYMGWDRYCAGCRWAPYV